MSPVVLRWILAIVIAAHGIGHGLFFWANARITPLAGAAGGTWLFPAGVGDSIARILGSALWLAVLFGFMAAGFGVVTLQAWWRPVVLLSAAVSLGLLVLFGSGLNTQWVFSAAVMNLIILVALLLIKWPSEAAMGW